MSAALVEIKDSDTFAFYQGIVKDFQNDHLLIHYESGWKNDVWVSPSLVRLSVPPHDSSKFFPSVGQEVEAQAKSHESEPFSWWRAKIKAVRGEFYQISYCDWDDSYNEFMERELLRPVNPNRELDAANLQKIEIVIPQALWDDEDQKLKMQSYSELQQSSGILTLLEDPEKKVLIIIGTRDTIPRAKTLISMHFKHRTEMKKLEAKKKEATAILEEEKRRLDQGSRIEFDVKPDLMGLVIGKKGSNIKNAEKIPGVISIKVHSDKGSIVILAKDDEAAGNARRALEFVEETFNVPRRMLARFVGKAFANIREIETNSQVQRIRVLDEQGQSQAEFRRNAQNDKAAASAAPSGGAGGRRNNNNNNTNGSGNNNANGNRPERRPFSYNSSNLDENVPLSVLGTREAVANAMVLLKQHYKNMIELESLQEATRDASDQLRQLSLEYGIRRPPRGADAPASSAPSEAKPPRRNNRRNNQDGNEEKKDAAAAAAPAAAAAAAASAAPAPAAAAAAAAADGAAAEPKRERKPREKKPRGDASAAVAAVAGDK